MKLAAVPLLAALAITPGAALAQDIDLFPDGLRIEHFVGVAIGAGQIGHLMGYFDARLANCDIEGAEHISDGLYLESISKPVTSAEHENLTSLSEEAAESFKELYRDAYKEHIGKPCVMSTQL